MPEVIACLCPGETFSSRWVDNWTNLYGFLLQSGFGVAKNFDFTSNPYHTRNMMADWVLKAVPNADYVLWIDDDNIFDPVQFERLYMGLQKHPEADAVFGWAWCENDQYEVGAMISCGIVDESGRDRALDPKEIIGHEELIEIGYSGFPAVLMRGNLLREASENPFSPIVSPQYCYGYSGEDFAFCRRVIGQGKHLFVDPLCQVPHLKQRAITPSKILKLTSSQPTECAA